MLLSALPTGWSLLGRCRFGTAGPIGPASGCHALAHPSIGVALVDVAPDATPNAEARLRRALGPADFWRDHPGALPVWHGRIEIGAVRRLPALLAEGFGTLPSLTVPGKGSWIEAVRQALAADEAWEVPGQPPRQRVLAPPMTLEDDDDVPVRKPARRRGWLYPGLATGAVVLAGLAWLVSAPLPEPAAPPPVQVAAAPATGAPATAAPAARAPAGPQPAAASPPPSQAVAAQPEPPLPPMERVVVALPAPVRQPPPEPVVVPAPPVAAVPASPVAAMPVAPPAEAVPASRATPLPEEVALVLPPPAPPPAPPRRVAAPRIDPGCTRALYRYQQGVTLTATETAHVRNGCATRR